MQEFLNNLAENNTETALQNICARLNSAAGRKNSLIINSADIATGAAVLFTDDFYTQAKNFTTLGTDDFFTALSSAAAPFGELKPYSCRGYLLCDYSLKYGSPVMALKYLGIKKTLSVNFSAAYPHTPYELAQNSMAEMHSAKSELFINISSRPASGSIANYANAATQAISEISAELAEKMLF